MSLDDVDLEPGDRIEIKYRVQRPQDGHAEYRERWIEAEIIACEPDTWPLAVLPDGQFTEVRRFMTWRHACGPHAGGVPGKVVE
jgi:hypothetical protein